jgi:ABC-type glycerol-3-phosphate transport system substrate-binding protein
MRRLVAALVSALLAAVVLAGCGNSTGSSASQGSGPPPTKVIDVTFSGDSVTPNGELIKVDVGQPIELDVTADAPGEIHVHSTPEQELEYDKGSSTITVAPITAPGRITVESHDLNKTLFVLQAQ